MQQRLIARISTSLVFLFEIDSNFRAPEFGGVLVVCEVLMASHHLYALVTLGIGNKVSWDGSVGGLALTSSKMPSISDHQLEVVVLIDTGTHVSVVVDELGLGDLAVLLDGIPLGQELL